MFDIDAGHGHALRLNTDKRRSAADEIADIDGQMAALCARRSELMMEIGSKVAQSEPIRASTGAVGEVTKAYRSGDTFTIEMTVDHDVLSATNDFWTHRHRVMAGTDPKIARTTGQIEFLHEDDGA